MNTIEERFEALQNAVNEFLNCGYEPLHSEAASYHGRSADQAVVDIRNWNDLENALDASRVKDHT